MELTGTSSETQGLINSVGSEYVGKGGKGDKIRRKSSIMVVRLVLTMLICVCAFTCLVALITLSVLYAVERSGKPQKLTLGVLSNPSSGDNFQMQMHEAFIVSNDMLKAIYDGKRKIELVFPTKAESKENNFLKFLERMQKKTNIFLGPLTSHELHEIFLRYPTANETVFITPSVKSTEFKMYKNVVKMSLSDDVRAEAFLAALDGFSASSYSNHNCEMINITIVQEEGKENVNVVRKVANRSRVDIFFNNQIVFDPLLPTYADDVSNRVNSILEESIMQIGENETLLCNAILLATNEETKEIFRAIAGTPAATVKWFGMGMSFNFDIIQDPVALAVGRNVSLEAVQYLGNHVRQDTGKVGDKGHYIENVYEKCKSTIPGLPDLFEPNPLIHMVYDSLLLIYSNSHIQKNRLPVDNIIQLIRNFSQSIYGFSGVLAINEESERGVGDFIHMSIAPDDFGCDLHWTPRGFVRVKAPQFYGKRGNKVYDIRSESSGYTYIHPDYYYDNCTEFANVELNYTSISGLRRKVELNQDTLQEKGLFLSHLGPVNYLQQCNDIVVETACGSSSGHDVAICRIKKVDPSRRIDFEDADCFYPDRGILTSRAKRWADSADCVVKKCKPLAVELTGEKGFEAATAALKYINSIQVDSVSDCMNAVVGLMGTVFKPK